jgi:hypothetical protein
MLTSIQAVHFWWLRSLQRVWARRSLSALEGGTEGVQASFHMSPQPTGKSNAADMTMMLDAMVFLLRQKVSHMYRDQ